MASRSNVLHLDGRGKARNYFKRWKEVRQRIAAPGYDVVHAQWGQSALVALPKRAPLVITFRGSDLEGIAGSERRYAWWGTLLTSLSKATAPFADQIIVVSARLTKYLGNRECHVIPSGLDLTLFTPSPMAEARRRLGLSPTRKYVLFAAAPANPVKRHGLAVQAVEGLKSQLDVELLAVHDVVPTAMPLYMNACDALILTSLHEGSPNVVKEALACNLPVVSVDVGDVQLRAGHVEGCIICPDDRPETLTRALATTLDRNQRVAGRASVLELDEAYLPAG